MADCSYLPSTFKKRLAIQDVKRASDGQGGFTETWMQVGVANASIEPLKAYERYQSAQLAAPVTHKIVMRYRKDVASTARLVYEGRVFNVKEVINQNEENRFLVIKAIEA